MRSTSSDPCFVNRHALQRCDVSDDHAIGRAGVLAASDSGITPRMHAGRQSCCSAGRDRLCWLRMEILRTIALYAGSNGMPFLVIGGHAVNSYGLDRHTGDLDLLVPRSGKPLWLRLMELLRYSIGQNTDTFARFRPDTIAAWPIDLMFVDDRTFEKMNAASTVAEFGVVQARVAGMPHLIALKIHALKEFQEHRDAKDFSDLLFLIQRSKISDAELQRLCTRYASDKLYRRVKGALRDE